MFAIMKEAAARPLRATETKRAAQSSHRIRTRCVLVGDAGRAARRSAVAVAAARNGASALRWGRR
jgi:hypothetical protein